jgi:hypothetical protein
MLRSNLPEDPDTKLTWPAIAILTPHDMSANADPSPTLPVDARSDAVNVRPATSGYSGIRSHAVTSGSVARPASLTACASVIVAAGVSTVAPSSAIDALTEALPAADAENHAGFDSLPEQPFPSRSFTDPHAIVFVPPPPPLFVTVSVTAEDALSAPNPGADVHTYATTWSLRS